MVSFQTVKLSQLDCIQLLESSRGQMLHSEVNVFLQIPSDSIREYLFKPGAKAYICFIIRAPAVPWCNAEEMTKHKGKSHDYDAWKASSVTSTGQDVKDSGQSQTSRSTPQILPVLTSSYTQCNWSFRAYVFSVEPIFENALLRFYFLCLIIQRSFLFPSSAVEKPV